MHVLCRSNKRTCQLVTTTFILTSCSRRIVPFCQSFSTEPPSLNPSSDAQTPPQQTNQPRSRDGAEIDAQGEANFLINDSAMNRLATSSTILRTSPHLTFHHLHNPVASTQDEARTLLHAAAASTRSDDANAAQALAVLADEQTSGRGTKGRKWEGGTRGNLYLTVCLPMEQIPVQLTLLPLQVGVLVAQRVQTLLQACHMNSKDGAIEKGSSPTTHASAVPPVRVKWPNDVLVGSQKIAGTLIESETVHGHTWLLIGVGVNIAFAPDLSQSPGKQIRPATALQDHCGSNHLQQLLAQRDADYGPENTQPATELDESDNSVAVLFGRDLANGLVDWTFGGAAQSGDYFPFPRATTKQDRISRGREVVDNWSALANFGSTYELRSSDVEKEQSLSYEGEKVTVVGIQDDGQLIVRGEDGKERLLITDYLF